MSKYQEYSARSRANPKKVIHPVWRGVGFVLLILTPIIAYAGTLVLLAENQKQGWIRIPSDLLVKGFSDPLILVKIILTILLMVLIYGIFSMITFILYSAFAPPRYGPQDVPPVQYRGKRYKR